MHAVFRKLMVTYVLAFIQSCKDTEIKIDLEKKSAELGIMDGPRLELWSLGMFFAHMIYQINPTARELRLLSRSISLYVLGKEQ